MHSKEFIERMKDRLQEEKERLTEGLAETPEHTEVGTDPEETETEDEIDMVNDDIRVQLKEDLASINAALERIEKGTYGVCTGGGEDIPESRLEAIPWAETCIEHENA